MKVGLIGCGDIARKAYIPFSQNEQSAYEIVACCDVRGEFARQMAEDFSIPKAYDDVDQLLADDEIDIILNLTHPAGHGPLNLAALQAGKHVHCEKPFAVTLEEGKAVLEEAERRGLKTSCAPDTVLGPGTQTCRKLVADGVIGEVLSAKLQLTGAGHEHWHPNPEFYYKKGGGPLLDMGPYYLSFLVQLLGPVKSVQGRAITSFKERPFRCGEREGETIEVETPTFYVGSLETESGVIVSVQFSFDHPFGFSGSFLPEIYGTQGCLTGTDPNNFDGQPKLNTVWAGSEDPIEQPLAFDYAHGRGLGLVDLVHAVRENREPRCGGQLAYHTLEVMLAFEESERTGSTVEIQSSCDIPPAMPDGGLA